MKQKNLDSYGNVPYDILPTSSLPFNSYPRLTLSNGYIKSTSTDLNIMDIKSNHNLKINANPIEEKGNNVKSLNSKAYINPVRNIRHCPPANKE